MLGGLGNLANMLKVAKDLQGNLEKVQAQLAQKRFDGEAGGGLVRAVVNGKLALMDIKIDPQAAQDVELLEDLIKAAVGSAILKAQEGMKAEMSALTGGLPLPPGLTDLLGRGGG
ncbi:MAG TPA: YbaB/EbfC family nucleoid-associated protein [Phycisphaerae bacterium]|nr:YbaB/EbfC family nucleoid-associated protein [Phycisphaerae bacterium]HNU43750.1 YbaB/EbfC family nucleoid-associated protein [Phycisphaerae bacterium]